MKEKQNYIESPRVVTEALRWKTPIESIFVGNYVNTHQNENIRKIIQDAKLKKIPIKKVDKNILDQMSERGSHQGIIAKTQAFKYADLNFVLSEIKDKNSSLIIILDHIEDAGNLGAIARSACAFGASALIIPNDRSATVTATTYKTSAGAVFKLPIVKVANINNVIKQLKNNEFWITSATEHSAEAIWDINLRGKIAMVFGNEHSGISKLVLENSDFMVKLPISENIESLNVAQAATACMYEWVRQNA